MSKNILVTTLLVLLGLSPLIHFSLESFAISRTMWGWVILFIFFQLFLLWLFPSRVQKKIIGTWPFIGIVVLSMLFGVYSFQSSASIYILFLFLFGVGIKTISDCGNDMRQAMVLCMLGIIGIYAQWGIVQFITQHDLGLSIIGESRLIAGAPGVASFTDHETKYIRAYGPFGHPNSFAGVLVLGLILLYLYRASFPTNVLPLLLGSLYSLALFFTFSRTGIACALLLGLYCLWNMRGKYQRTIMFIILILCTFLAPLLISRSFDTRGVALEDRIAGYKWSIHMQSPRNALLGYGLGNYTRALTDYLYKHSIPHDKWDIAPIHSVPLLLFNELGLLCCIALLLLIIQSSVFKKYGLLMIGVAPALFFDHYFATQFAPTLFLISTAILRVY